MEVMLAKKKPLSELAAPFEVYPKVLENVRVTDKKAAQDDAAVQKMVQAVAEALGDTGRILVRESGTEPVVRVMVEVPEEEICRKYVDEVVLNIAFELYRRGRYDKIIYNLSFERNERNSTIRVL